MEKSSSETRLPSPLIEWEDFYYQTLADVAAEIEKDRKYVRRILRKVRDANGKERRKCD